MPIKPEPPPTRDVNRDNGIAPANDSFDLLLGIISFGDLGGNFTTKNITNYQ